MCDDTSKRLPRHVCDTQQARPLLRQSKFLKMCGSISFGRFMIELEETVLVYMLTSISQLPTGTIPESSRCNEHVHPCTEEEVRSKDHNYLLLIPYKIQNGRKATFLSSFPGITASTLQESAACAFITRDQKLSSSRRLSAQTRHRTHRTRATQQPYSAQPGVVRGLRLGTRQAT